MTEQQLEIIVISVAVIAMILGVIIVFRTISLKEQEKELKVISFNDGAVFSYINGNLYIKDVSKENGFAIKKINGKIFLIKDNFIIPIENCFFEEKEN